MSKQILTINLKTVLVLLTLLISNTAAFSQEKDVDDQGFKIGVLGSNFVNYTTDEMIQQVSRLNIQYLSVKEKHLPFESTDDEIAAFKAKLLEKRIVANSTGLFYLNKKEEIDRVFDYAKRIGVPMIIGTPQYELLPYVEEKVKEYDLQLAIHIHGGDIPQYPNAEDVYNHIKDMDHRIGICLDMGHERRGGFDPAESLEKYKDRILDIQIKDITATDRSGRTCIVGQGVLDIPAFVKMLHKVGYTGVCSFELEENRKDPLPALAESKGYFEAINDLVK
jgi:sugar phosphate isomerase/epimerase